jgi:hypothetical protein
MDRENKKNTDVELIYLTPYVASNGSFEHDIQTSSSIKG